MRFRSFCTGFSDDNSSCFTFSFSGSSSGFFILVEIQKETISKNKSLVNLENIKNQYIKKYSNTILELRKNGMGSQSIVKHLYENHRVKVSRGTIEKFYKQNNL